MIEVPQCYVCKHFNHKEKGFSCKAYPDGIPDKIYSEVELHDKINAGQAGDYTFEPEEDEGEVVEEVPADIKNIFDHIIIK